MSFVVQGAGHLPGGRSAGAATPGTPFAGIVSSGRLAAMYERWGAEFLVAEGAEAGGHIGDIDHPLRRSSTRCAAPRRSRSSPPAASTREDVAALLARGAAGVQLATRFLACADGDRSPAFKADAPRGGRRGRHGHHELREGDEGARDPERLHGRARARARHFPPRSKAWFFGQGRLRRPDEGLHRVPRRGALQVPRERLPRELLHHGRAAAGGDPGRHGARAVPRPSRLRPVRLRSVHPARDPRPSPPSTSGGASARQRSSASGQRGWKWQPAAATRGSAARPRARSARRVRVGSGTRHRGEERARVRMAGGAEDAARGPASTMRPRYITATRSAMCCDDARGRAR